MSTQSRTHRPFLRAHRAACLLRKVLLLSGPHSEAMELSAWSGANSSPAAAPRWGKSARTAPGRLLGRPALPWPLAWCAGGIFGRLPSAAMGVQALDRPRPVGHGGSGHSCRGGGCLPLARGGVRGGWKGGAGCPACLFMLAPEPGLLVGARGFGVWSVWSGLLDGTAKL